MLQTALFELGSCVKVDLQRVRDRIPNNLYSRLSIEPNCTVLDYKMMDGNMIGYIMQLNDGSISWFFHYEIADLPNDRSLIVFNNSIASSDKSLLNSSLVSPLVRSNSNKVESWLPQRTNRISYLFNPFNFLRWFIYSTKDVI